MKRLVALLFIVMLLGGCRSSDRVDSTGRIGSYLVVCIDGVEYLEKTIVYQGYAVPQIKWNVIHV